jgi:hypothetical protein
MPVPDDQIAEWKQAYHLLGVPPYASTPRSRPPTASLRSPLGSGSGQPGDKFCYSVLSNGNLFF